MPTQRDLLTIIQRLIAKETVFLRHYIGKVLNNDCSLIPELLNTGMVQIAIYDLGYDSADIAFWCSPRNKNAMVSPKVGDWVEVYFINGDRDRPVFIADAQEISGQLPKNYDGKPTTQLLFEDNNNQIHIKFDELLNILEIGNSDLQFAARKGDATLSNSSTDSSFWSFWSAFYAVVKGAPIPEPGSGSPSAFQAALAAAIAAISTPTSMTGKINAGSTQTKIGS